MEEQKKQFELDGITYEIEIREDSDYKHTPWKFHRSTARAFVWSKRADLDEAPLEELAKQLGFESRYTDKGESKEMDKAWRAFNKQIVKIETEILEAGLAALGIEGVTFKFSRYAGCSCPCSPGFIISKESPIYSRYNVFISEVKKEVPSRYNLVEA